MEKILIIEDNVDLGGNIFLYLKETGFNAFLAHTGEKGMKIIMEENPDLILCDIMLPDINGYKLLTELKKLDEKMMPVFIFLTAKTQREDLRKGMNIGADDYITKPFTNNELMNAIRTQLQKRKKIAESFNRDSEENGNGRRKSVRSMESGEPEKRLNYEGHIFINDKRSPGFYSVNEIQYIKSLKDYTRIYMTDGRRYIMRKPMIHWVRMLPDEQFLRIHRQTIINLNYVSKMEPLPSNRLAVIMKHSGKRLEVSQRYHGRIKNYFS